MLYYRTTRIGESGLLRPLVFFALIHLFISFPNPIYADQSALEEVHRGIESRYPRVNHINSVEFEEKLLGSSEIVLFDVREQPEYEVSHLEGAIRVDPDIGRREFNKLYNDELEGKTVVFYCSVGRRSSHLANKVSSDILEQGAINSYNLTYGIFGWHNNRNPLVDNKNSTNFIHPYNNRWGRLIEHKKLIRYSAE